MSKKPKSILWELDDHSRGKHMVLAEYLAGWMRIVGTGEQPLQVVDGFAGPGEYANGVDGSPLIMIRAALRAPAPRNGQPINFHFMEENSARADHLSTVLAREFPSLPPHIRYTIANSPFTAIAEAPVVASGRMAPSFVMVDPFGFSQTPMRVLNQLMKSRSCEVYVSVMFDHVARFNADPKLENHYTELFGTDEWQVVAALRDHEAKRSALQNLYESQLRKNGAKYVVTFHLWNGGIYKYSICFGTSHPLGCGLMKDSLWKALGSDLPLALPISARNPARELSAQLFAEFRGKAVGVEFLDSWIRSDANIYAPSHLRSALKLLEAAKCISVVAPTGQKRRAGTFPPGKSLQIAVLEDGELSRIR
jgi:three-Cys-motif partner protein